MRTSSRISFKSAEYCRTASRVLSSIFENEAPVLTPSVRSSTSVIVASAFTAGLAMGLLVGLFLLIIASLLRVFAPLFSALVQASTSREREFLADATSVEFTRNAAGLERALATLAGDTDHLEAANRGTQHLWFRNPVKAGSDRRTSLLSTHPSLGARIDRLRALQGLAPLDADGTSPTASET